MRILTYINMNLLYSEINSQYHISQLEFDNEEFSLKIIRMDLLLSSVYQDLGKTWGTGSYREIEPEFIQNA